MWLIVWNGEKEAHGQAPGLSQYVGGSAARACMAWLHAGETAADRCATWGHKKPLQGGKALRAQELHRQGLGIRRIARQLRTSEWQVRGVLRRQGRG